MNDTSNETIQLVKITNNLIKNVDFLISGFQEINKTINKNYIFVGKSLKDQEQKGINKLISELKSEKKYLKKLLQNKEKIQPANIYCSNLSYFSAIYQVAIAEKNVTNVYEPITYFNTETNTKETVRIDVISNNGLHWIKVKAGNSINHDSKFQNSLDNNSIGEKETTRLLNLLQKIQNASKQHLIHYRQPKIILKMMAYPSEEDLITKSDISNLNTSNINNTDNGNDDLKFLKKIEELKTSIEKVNIHNPFEDDFQSKLPSPSTKELSNTKNNSHIQNINNLLQENHLFTNTLFLDVTALIAIVSDLTNLPPQVIPPEPLKPIKPLYQQYIDEKSKEIPSFMTLLHSLLYHKPTENQNELEMIKRPDQDSYHQHRLYHHRQLITCMTAIERFWNIVKIIAGPRELQRTINLFDCSENSEMMNIQKEMENTLHQKFNQDKKDQLNHCHGNFYDYLIETENEHEQTTITHSTLDYTQYEGALPKWLPQIKVIKDQPSDLFIELMISSKQLKQKKNKNNKNTPTNKNDNKRKGELNEENNNDQTISKNETNMQHKEKKLKVKEESRKDSSSSSPFTVDNSTTHVNENKNDKIRSLDSTEIIFGTSEALHLTFITANDKKIKNIITEWRKKHEELLIKRSIPQNNNEDDNRDDDDDDDKNDNYNNSHDNDDTKAIRILSNRIKNNIQNSNFSYWIHPPRSLIEVRAFSEQN